MVQQQQGISLAQASQGGLLDDADVEILDAAFAEWDYQGNLDHSILALGVQYADLEGKTYDQYYSAGELTYFVPSSDGSMAVPVGDKALLADSCNAWKFIQSLMEADQTGAMTKIMESGNVKNLVGAKIHVKQYAQPKRQGLIRGGKNADREPSILLCDAILELPGGKTAGKAPARRTAAPAARTAAPGPVRTGLGKPAQAPARPIPPSRPGLGGKAPATPPPATRTTSPSKTNGQAEPDGDQELANVAMEIVMEIVTESGQVAKKDLNTLVFRKAGERVQAGVIDAKQKTKVTQLAWQDSFLHELAQSGMVEYDGATIALPQEQPA